MKTHEIETVDGRVLIFEIQKEFMAGDVKFLQCLPLHNCLPSGNDIIQYITREGVSCLIDGDDNESTVILIHNKTYAYVSTTHCTLKKSEIFNQVAKLSRALKWDSSHAAICTVIKTDINSNWGLLGPLNS